MTEIPDATTAPKPHTDGIASMRGGFARHALVRDALPVSPGPLTRDSEAFKRLADDLPVRRVLWMLASGWTWPWLLDDATTPAARNRAIRRGLMAPPVGEPDAVLVPYHLTDAGRAELLNWVERITPHRHLPEVDALWRVVTWK
ncbi:hypothetical protein SAMN04488074_108228 [Lentzea albidocapillata subsp. violacea]|uniref:Uncharacterized protein n=1 Tax=Lentzea albidocapillata subsp. violacea TaxID=128104 RepID=A0A1G9GJ82_9PSEU|nr:hypothetical protein [Lentzea albidocapillata]SDL00662.1 hypothetical protein SAMN04488074_108228 [Lentzea albidocapillata subsp. violacea]